MRHQKSAALLALAGLTLITGAAACAEKTPPTYDLRKEVADARFPRVAVGDIFEVAYVSSTSGNVVFSRPEDRVEQPPFGSTVSARCIERIDEIEDTGARRTIHVVEWSSAEGGIRGDSLQGVTLLVDGDDWSVRGGGDVSAATREWIELYLVRGAADLDTYFGTQSPLDTVPGGEVRVGDSWDVPPAPLEAILTDLAGGDLADVVGTVQLAAVQDVVDGRPSSALIETRATARIMQTTALAPTREVLATSTISWTLREQMSFGSHDIERATDIAVVLNRAMRNGAIATLTITTEFDMTIRAGAAMPLAADAPVDEPGPPDTTASTATGPDVRNVEIPRKGAFAEIDVESTRAATRVLRQGPAKDRTALIARMKANPGEFAPPALFVLADELFTEGDEADAAFWFDFASVRARYDEARCADRSAHQGVSILRNRFEAPIRKWTIDNLDSFLPRLDRVLELEARTPCSYDHRWLNLHGMGAAIAGLGGEQKDAASLSLPEDEWPELHERVRKTYRDGAAQAVENVKEWNRLRNEGK